MKLILAAFLIVSAATSSAFAMPSIQLLETLIKDLSTMNNERVGFAQTTLVDKKSLTKRSQVITYQVELLERQNAKAFQVDIYNVIVEDGLIIRSIQLVK